MTHIKSCAIALDMQPKEGGRLNRFFKRADQKLFGYQELDIALALKVNDGTANSEDLENYRKGALYRLNRQSIIMWLSHPTHPTQTNAAIQARETDYQAQTLKTLTGKELQMQLKMHAASELKDWGRLPEPTQNIRESK